MGSENLMRAAEIEQQANNAQKQVMREKRDKLDQVKRMNRDADDIKNEAMLYKAGSNTATNQVPKQRLSSLAMARRKEAKAKELKTKAKELEKQVLRSTSDQDFKIKEMYDAARKLRTEA